MKYNNVKTHKPNSPLRTQHLPCPKCSPVKASQGGLVATSLIPALSFVIRT